MRKWAIGDLGTGNDPGTVDTRYRLVISFNTTPLTSPPMA